jgi:hypothetical protein
LVTSIGRPLFGLSYSENVFPVRDRGEDLKRLGQRTGLVSREDLANLGVNLDNLGRELILVLIGRSQIVLSPLLRRLVGSNLLQNEICEVDTVALLLSCRLKIPAVLQQLILLLIRHELSIHVEIIGIDFDLFYNLIILAPSFIVIVDLVLLLSLDVKSRVVAEVVGGRFGHSLSSVFLLGQLATYAQDGPGSAIVDKGLFVVAITF